MTVLARQRLRLRDHHRARAPAAAPAAAAPARPGRIPADEHHDHELRGLGELLAEARAGGAAAVGTAVLPAATA